MKELKIHQEVPNVMIQIDMAVTLKSAYNKSYP